ncbi:MAG: hypothetical protein J0M29_08235 [Chitinophagales bacterium]|nr:hypothetical protein [Chitinophagales bacterium]
MKLSKALSDKNRLARKIKELQQKIEANNSYIKGNTPAYKVADLLGELETAINELTALKTNIQKANQPVQDKIFRLAELKSFAAFLRRLKIKEGKILEERWNAEVREWESGMGTVDRDKLLEKTEKEIETIQVELDKFNFETEV